jgi:uncharacterized protein YdaU (DUF1376 family)
MPADPIRIPPVGAPPVSTDSPPEDSPNAIAGLARSAAKPRHVDYYADEFLGGTAILSLEETGAYIKVISLIYSCGGPVEDDEQGVARAIGADVRTWRRLRHALLDKGKLIAEGGKLVNRRCATELAKAHRRIDEARKNGALGGRPPRRSPEDRPKIDRTSAGSPGEVSRTSRRSAGDVSPISEPDLLDINVLAEPDGSPHRKPNHQPPTTNHQEEEEPPSRPNGKKYAFSGKIIRLTEADFDKWQKLYNETIPDLTAQLADDDDYYDRTLVGQERKEWFHRLKRKLGNHHQKVLRERAKRGGNANLNDSF